MQPETLSKAIQLSVAPVFLLAGIGALLNVISTRLARIVDATKRAKEGVLAGNPIDEQERRCYRRRMQLTIRAIELLTGSTLLIAAVVAENAEVKSRPVASINSMMLTNDTI